MAWTALMNTFYARRFVVQSLAETFDRSLDVSGSGKSPSLQHGISGAAVEQQQQQHTVGIAGAVAPPVASPTGAQSALQRRIVSVQKWPRGDPVQHQQRRIGNSSGQRLGRTGLAAWNTHSARIAQSVADPPYHNH